MDAQLNTQRVNQRELDLLRVLGQELKIPLMHIAGISDLLSNTSTLSEAEKLESLQRIHMSADQSLQLIDTLLLAGQIESKQLSLALEPLNISSVVHATVHELQPFAFRYNRTLHVSQKGKSMQLAAAHAPALKHALRSVVAMAIRSSESEVIELIMSSNEHAVELTIRDDGELIAKRSIDRALRSFGTRAQLLKELPNSAGLSVYAADIIARAQAGQFTIGRQRNKRIMSFSLVRSQQLQLAL